MTNERVSDAKLLWLEYTKSCTTNLFENETDYSLITSTQSVSQGVLQGTRTPPVQKHML